MDELNYVAEVHKTLQKQNIMLAYDGVLSKDIVSAFLIRLRKDIEVVDNVPKKEKKRFFSIVVECIQNLSKHGNVSDLNDEHFLVIVEKEKNTLKISTGNLIANDRKKSIEKLINDVNNKNHQELQALYRDGIANNVLSQSGEASLGLIDIARKSTNKLLYKFSAVDDKSTFFLFQTELCVAN